MHDTRRRTGRTILTALAAASESRRVLVRVHSDQYARDLLPTAAKIADGYYSKVDVFAREITFDGGGAVRFIGREYSEPPGFTDCLPDHFTGR